MRPFVRPRAREAPTRCCSTPSRSSSARSCCSSSSRSWRSRSCRGSADRRPCGPRASCSSRRRCSPATRTRTGRCASVAPRRSVQLHVALLVAEPRRAADRPRRALEAGRRREPVVAHPRPARGDRSGCPTSCCRPPARWCRRGSRAASPARSPVPAVRAVEPRVDARAAGLPVPARAVERDARAGARLVGRLRRFRAALCAAGWLAACDGASRRRRARALAAGRRRPAAAGHRSRARRPPTAGAPGSCGARSRRRPRSCCSRSATTSRRTSRRCRCCGSCRSRSTSSPSSSASTARGWYRRDIVLSMTAAALGVMAWTLADPSLTHELEIQVGVFCVGLFIACMFCHGELVRLKPAPRHLTRFYLMISLGGAVGVGARRHPRAAAAARPLRAAGRAGRCARCCCCGRCAATIPSSACSGSRRCSRRSAAPSGARPSSTAMRSCVTRNFYGVLRVQEVDARIGEPPAQPDPRHHPARQAVPRPGAEAPGDHLLHDHLGHRPPDRVAASAQHAAARSA